MLQQTALELVLLASPSEKDINEVFEDLLFTEEGFIEQGYREGFESTASKENKEAYHLGYHRGAEVGAEIGYYKSVVDHYLSVFEKDGLSNHEEKVVKSLRVLSESLISFPVTNNEDIDILGLLSDVRAKFKKVCALLKVTHLLFNEIDDLSF